MKISASLLAVMLLASTAFGQGYYDPCQQLQQRIQQCVPQIIGGHGMPGWHQVPIAPPTNAPSAEPQPWRPSPDDGCSLPAAPSLTRPPGVPAPTRPAPGPSSRLPGPVPTPAKRCPCQETQTKILAKLQELEAKVDALGGLKVQPTPEFAEMLVKLQSQLEELKLHSGADVSGKLDALATKVDAVTPLLEDMADNQQATADSLAAVADKLNTTAAKLDEVTKVLQQEGVGGTLTLTVASTPNLPASYVDTSTIWAVQRKTGVVNAVLVINGDDPEWERLQPEYERAHHKFPAMQLLDVSLDSRKISPTPQLVLYYANGDDPEVIEGDRDVASKLREFYSD